jgi:hypothetical protein
MPYPNPEGWTTYTAGLYPADSSETRSKIALHSIIRKLENFGG